MNFGGSLGVLVRNLGRQMACFFVAILLADLAVAATAGSAPYDMLRAMSPADRAQALQMLKQQTGDTGAEKPLVADQKLKTKDALGIEGLQGGKNAKQDMEKGQFLSMGPPRLEGGDSIIVSFDKRPLLPGEQEKLDASRNADKPRYTADRPQRMYTLDKYGMLEVQNVGRIALAGLTEQEAALRINLEPLLEEFLISVRRLPLAPVGNAALKPYGYELLRSASGGLEPPSDIPVPSDYSVGPGDTVHLQLFGKDNQSYALQVSREGALLLPGLGSIRVAGLKFDELRTAVRRRIENQYMGVTAEVTLGELRSMRIFVLGEVDKPGAHSVSGFASMTHALYTAGGITEIGSLRAVELKRDGKTIETLDLYDLLLRGDMRKDTRLKASDVVYVPAIRNTVSVSGEVRRPAIYELKQEKTVGELIELAGGLLPNAYSRSARLNRVGGPNQQIIDINLAVESGLRTELVSGDSLEIGQSGQQVENVVSLMGHVRRPGPHQWKEGMRVSDVVTGAADLLPNADLDYVMIRRVGGAEQRVSVLSANLREALANPTSHRNPVLMPRDEVTVFDLSDKRSLVVQPLMDELLAQSTSSTPTPVVRIAGSVRAAGAYPLEQGMHISDLVRAGGRLKESAFTLEAELTRFEVGHGEPRAIEHVHVNLEKALAGDKSADIALQPYDLLHIKQIPQWDEQDQVEVRGEVRFPGRYPIRRGETMRSLLERIGGLTQAAYPQGAVFMRKDLRAREQERLDKMAASLEAELARVSLERATETAQAQSLAVSKQLLDQIRSTKAAGRLVIEMESDPNSPIGVVSKDASLEIVLRGGDVLVVPPKMQEVTVVGEVFYPTSHLFSNATSHRDYIGLSGGGTRKADMDNAYVVRANGSVRPVTDGRWFGEDVEMKPGDTVVVPLDAERVSRLALWTNVSQIVYQLGLAAAAWHTVGILK